MKRETEHANPGRRFGWFGPKTYGWGVSPRSSGGWIVMVLFVIATFVIARQHQLPPRERLFLIGVAAAVLILIVVLTYERDP